MSATVRANFSAVNTLAEIKAAADSLPNEQKEELLRVLAVRLRRARVLPAMRIYSDEELAAMIAEDEAAGAQFRQAR